MLGKVKKLGRILDSNEFNVNKISEVLISEVGAIQIYLFGSYAYGTADEDSDIDLYVVADLAGRKKIDVTKDARRALLKHVFMPVDILVSDINEFNIRKENQTTLEYIVAREGVRLYG